MRFDDVFGDIQAILENLDAEMHIHRDQVLGHWTVMVLVGPEGAVNCKTGEGESVEAAFIDMCRSVKAVLGPVVEQTREVRGE